MFETVALEDLELLGAHDLESVFEKLPRAVLIRAIWGLPSDLRRRLLRVVSGRFAATLAAELAKSPQPTLQQVRAAHEALLQALCDLSRSGLIAFDLPEDMVA